jgi:hypothetical protein
LPAWRSIVTSALKMETVCFSETLASTDESIRRQNPEEHHHPHRRENFKYRIIINCIWNKKALPEQWKKFIFVPI